MCRAGWAGPCRLLDCFYAAAAGQHARTAGSGAAAPATGSPACDERTFAATSPALQRYLASMEGATFSGKLCAQAIAGAC